jgi:cellulose synthase/poly-beta-1,6-N-acetylglucosamine synthase-like glycosyltransferase
LLRLTAGARPILSGRELRVTSPASGLLAERLLDAGMANPVVSSVPEPPDAAYAFVVPVRDRPRELDRLLTSIGTGHPVIVVDDASQRREAVEAVAVTHGVKFLPLATNVGPAGARNAGLRLVTTPYVVFVDSDVVLTPDTVTTLLKHFTDPKVAMAVPRITALSTSNSTN